MITLLNDPLATVIQAALEIAPDLDAEVAFVEELADENGEPVAASTLFPNDGSTPLVEIVASVPFAGVTELLAHELAHIIVGPDAEEDDHGPLWEAAFGDIHERYLRLMGDEEDGPKIPSVHN